MLGGGVPGRNHRPTAIPWRSFGEVCAAVCCLVGVAVGRWVAISVRGCRVVGQPSFCGRRVVGRLCCGTPGGVSASRAAVRAPNRPRAPWLARWCSAMRGAANVLCLCRVYHALQCIVPCCVYVCARLLWVWHRRMCPWRYWHCRSARGAHTVVACRVTSAMGVVVACVM